MRKVSVTLVVLALMAMGCGKESTPQTRTIHVDNKTSAFNGAFLAYFPNSIQVHAGDTLDFKEMWTGEPHTVTMGRSVDQALDAQDKASNEKPAPAFTKLPSFAGDKGDIHQDAAQPCYMTSGLPSSKDFKACPKTDQPEFDGKQSYYNSGFLPEGKTFKVKLADAIAPGKYRFYCNLHGTEMQGSFTVTDNDTDVPTQDAVDKAAKAQLKKTVDKLTSAIADAKAGKSPFPGNLAGFGAEGENAAVNEFIPATINAKVGEKVSWTLVGFHTISFNAPNDVGADVSVAPNGTVNFNPKVFAPAGGPPAAAGTGGQGINVHTTDAGTFDGTGFKSSGAGDSFPPNLAGYAVTFTKPGTYAFQCLLHPGMAGSVVVK